MPRENTEMHERSQSIDELIAGQKPGHALSQPFYSDPAIYDLEIDRVVLRNWIMAGHQSEFPDPGDFKVIEVADESAIIVRGNDGSLSAFANVCRHRGSLVCLAPSGNTRKFTCPYHGWTYDTDGNLIAARNMPGDFDKSGYSLKRVSVGTVHGVVLVSFTEDPPSLEGAIRDLAEPLETIDFENLKVAAHKTYDIAANWKLSVENYQECYHCANAHPEYAIMHTGMLDEDKRERLQEHMFAKMEACGLRHFELDYYDTHAREGEISYGYHRTALFEGYKTGSKDGKPVAPLLGKLSGYDGGTTDLALGPLSYFLAYSDHVVAYVFTPVDQENCKCEVYWLVRGDAVEGRDYQLDNLTWLWDLTTYADEEIIVNNWKGVNSKFYRPGVFSSMEEPERHFVNWILQELRRAPKVSA